MTMNYWLVKSEPIKYPWQQFQKDGKTCWDGVRNYQARNNLKAMQLQDLVLYYHSNIGMEIVGIAQVVATAYPDPTTDDKNWVAVDLIPMVAFAKALPLAQIKLHPALQNIALIKQSRLSVMPISEQEYTTIVALSE